MSDELVALLRRESANMAEAQRYSGHGLPLTGLARQAADRIEAQAAEIEELKAALQEIARLRTNLSGDFSRASKQSDIARKALARIDAVLTR